MGGCLIALGGSLLLLPVRYNHDCSDDEGSGGPSCPS